MAKTKSLQLLIDRLLQGHLDIRNLYCGFSNQTPNSFFDLIRVLLDIGKVFTAAKYVQKSIHYFQLRSGCSILE
ncbi:hypothetical protein AV530_013898 [Patagioenas fasciata monilis]|uniref:Uncharacterized protein n=1 Tax=Patagioenas fasciata monilis TaxID=372326 RepID=A0A1V4KN00_PATFA|nr:hypothetical protein AV530_013898 [Patagioenas fasciata monilis]